jgi:hypothetical protein
MADGGNFHRSINLCLASMTLELFFDLDWCCGEGMEEIFSCDMRMTRKKKLPKGVPRNIFDFYWRPQKVALIPC